MAEPSAVLCLTAAVQRACCSTGHGCVVPHARDAGVTSCDRSALLPATSAGLISNTVSLPRVKRDHGTGTIILAEMGTNVRWGSACCLLPSTRGPTSEDRCIQHVVRAALPSPRHPPACPRACVHARRPGTYLPLCCTCRCWSLPAWRASRRTPSTGKRRRRGCARCTPPTKTCVCTRGRGRARASHVAEHVAPLSCCHAAHVWWPPSPPSSTPWPALSRPSTSSPPAPPSCRRCCSSLWIAGRVSSQGTRAAWGPAPTRTTST